MERLITALDEYLRLLDMSTAKGSEEYWGAEDFQDLDKALQELRAAYAEFKASL